MLNVLANVVRPILDGCVEPYSISNEERTQRFFKPDFVSGDGGHKPIRRIPQLPRMILLTRRPHFLLDQLPQCHRRPARLASEPVPMPRKQCHLTRHNAQLRPPGSSRRLVGQIVRRNCIARRTLQPSEHIFNRPLQIQIDLLAGHSIKDQHHMARLLIQRPLRSNRRIHQRTMRHTMCAFKSNICRIHCRQSQSRLVALILPG
jgi:hypothetical protein